MPTRPIPTRPHTSSPPWQLSTMLNRHHANLAPGQLPPCQLAPMPNQHHANSPPCQLAPCQLAYYANLPHANSAPCQVILFTSHLQGFRILNSNDLWPPLKTIGFLLSTWQIYILNMKSVGHSYLKISRLQGFWSLTSGDLKWPLTSTKNNRVLPLNMTNLCTKYEKHRSFLSWDIAIKRFSDFDLWWP